MEDQGSQSGSNPAAPGARREPGAGRRATPTPAPAGWRMDPCRACPRRCGARRLAGAVGRCGAAAHLPVLSAFAHHGEERPLSGHQGSGTIFFGGCNLACLFCQNADISQGRVPGPMVDAPPPSGAAPASPGADPAARASRPLLGGEELTPAELSALMLRLQARGCHNINLVSPSHLGPLLLEALPRARSEGLTLPVVWNSGGYDDVDLLRRLAGWVDIYLADAKYWDPEVGMRLSGVPDYPAVMRAALREMHRQVGTLRLDERGVARAGLLVRHLVLPEGLAGTEGVLGFIAAELSTDTYVNLMGQYRPCHRAHLEPRLRRAPTAREMQQAFEIAARVGLHRLDGRPGRRGG